MVCVFCKKTIEKETAYSFIMEGQKRRKYCCSEEEWKEQEQNAYAESKAWNYSEEIVGHNHHTFKNRMWRQILSEYSGTEIYEYLKEEKENIKRYMSTKNFDTEYLELAYYKSILVNNLRKRREDMKTVVKNTTNVPTEDLSNCLIGEGVVPVRKKRSNFSEIA